jgi:hypothetical protein
MKSKSADFLKHELKFSPAVPTHRFMEQHLGKMVTAPCEVNVGELSVSQCSQ